MSQKSYLGKIKGLNVAVLVIAAVNVFLAILLLFGVSMLNEQIAQNGGFGSIASALTQSTSAQNQLGAADSLSQSFNSEEFATNPNSASAITSKYQDQIASAFVAVVAMFVLMLVMSLANVVFSILLLIFHRKPDKAKTCLIFNICNIVASVLSFNLPNTVLSIISTVFVAKQKQIN